MGYPSTPTCSSSQLEPTTVQSELDRAVMVIGQIENQLFIQYPQAENCKEECVRIDNKLVLTRNQLTSIIDRLITINESLTFLGNKQ